jgi:hypothetical protein
VSTSNSRILGPGETESHAPRGTMTVPFHCRGCTRVAAFYCPYENGTRVYYAKCKGTCFVHALNNGNKCAVFFLSCLSIQIMVTENGAGPSNGDVICRINHHTTLPGAHHELVSTGAPRILGDNQNKVSGDTITQYR